MRKAILTFLLLAMPLLACNLSRTPPTPTVSPDLPTQATSFAPTLFASITPLPGTGSGTTATQPVPGIGTTTCTPPSGWLQYTIEAGDSLGALAEATGSTIQDLINGNCMSDPDTLFTGQLIYVPRSPISG
ncbi:MAG: LysM domain-containing protein [Chloroflexota bacterium]